MIVSYLYRARYALLVILLGLGSAAALVRFNGLFEALPLMVQALLVLLTTSAGVFLIWKDREQGDKQGYNG